MPAVRALTLIVTAALMPLPAAAQRIAPSGVVARPSSSSERAAIVSRRDEVFDGERAISGGILGTFAGAAVGALGAYVLTHTHPGVDHMMDGVVYLYLVPIGAAVGLFVGTIVGGSTHG